MISVPAHPIAREFIRNTLLPNEEEDIARTRKWDDAIGADFKADFLGGQLNRLSSRIQLFVGGDPGWSELLYWTRQLTRGTAALFTYLRRPERSHWRLRGHDRVIVGTPDPMYVREDAWSIAFWLAFAVRDACSLALLLQTPANAIEATEEYQRPAVAAIQSTFARLPGTGSRIIEALALADPEKTRRIWPPAVLDLVVPTFEPLFAIADRDQPRFTASLQKLLELRRQYYLREGPDGEICDGRSNDNLSVDAVGLIAWARTLGMTVDVESGYAPRQLLDVSAPEIETCPVCLTPSDDDDAAARCHACDAPRGNTLEFGFAEWVGLDREPCRACAHAFPVIATACPVCLASRRREA